MTEVPGPWHGRIVDRLARMFIHYDEQHPGRVNYRAGGGECRMRLPGMVSDRHPDHGHLPRPGAIRRQGLDEMDAAHRRRGRQPWRRATRFRRSARGVSAGGRARDTGSWTPNIDGCTPSSARATSGRRRLCPNPVSTTLCSSPACKSGPPSCLGPLRCCALTDR